MHICSLAATCQYFCVRRRREVKSQTAQTLIFPLDAQADWREHWPLIGWEGSRDQDTGL